MSILVLRAGLFHKIKASKYQDLYALEIENPYIKKDLVRMEDVYGRKNKDYESLSKTKKITKKNTVFKLPTLNHKHIYNLNKIKLEIAYYKDFKKFNNFDDRSISIILDGSMITKKRKKVIDVGEIVKSYTLIKLSEYFSIDKKILILKATKQ
tara:strand:- start:144 stop:602 length:459 start_codon:yes stop_codon:yes gene_type:complete